MDWQNSGGERGSWTLDVSDVHRVAVHWDGGPDDVGFPFGYVVEDRRTGEPDYAYASSHAPDLETAQRCAWQSFQEGPLPPPSTAAELAAEMDEVFGPKPAM